MKNENWFKLRTISKTCDPAAMFGITDRANEQDYLYPDRSPRKGSTVIWHPTAKAHISVGSYVEAVRNHDEAALAKLAAIGIPADIDFGFRPDEDMSSTYTKLKVAKPRAKKADSVKVMRAKFASMFEDGGRFVTGDVVKIVFRKKFVGGAAGSKRFQNVYERPTADELKAFLAEEAGK